jgi:myosin heavy subunit
MNIVHISKEDQDNVFAMVSAVLWLGDVSFTIIDNENHVEIIVEEGTKNKYAFSQQYGRLDNNFHNIVVLIDD